MPRWLSTDVGGLGREVERRASIPLALAVLAGAKEVLAGALEGAVEGREELERVLGENLALGVGRCVGKDLYACNHDERAEDGWVCGVG